MNRYKPIGWRNESYRHSLAAKGIKTRHSLMPVFIYRKSVGNKHKGNEMDNELRALYGDRLLSKEKQDEYYKNYPDDKKRMKMEEEYIKDQLKEDKGKGDIDEIRWTDRDDFMIARYKRNEKTGKLENKNSMAGKIKRKEGVYETVYGNAVEVTDIGDGKFMAHDLDMGEDVPLGAVDFSKRIRDLDE